MNGGTIAENRGSAGGAICTMFSKTGGAVVIMNGGTIGGIDGDGTSHGNVGTGNGGAIFVHAKCQLILNGGTISGNQGAHGGAVYLHNNAANGPGTMKMTGGIITGNTATGNGGGVGMASAAGVQLSMTAGSISGNTAKLGSDVYVAGTMNMEGAAYVQNVYLLAGKKVNLTGTLTARETMTELTLPAYTTGTVVLSGDSTVISGSSQYFKLPANSGMEVAEDGTLQAASAGANMEVINVLNYTEETAAVNGEIVSATANGTAGSALKTALEQNIFRSALLR